MSGIHQGQETSALTAEPRGNISLVPRPQGRGKSAFLLPLRHGYKARGDQYIIIVIVTLLTLGACASEGYSSWVCVSVCVSVCLCVCLGKISFYVCSHQPVMVPTVCIRQILGLKRVDFTKNARIESYGDKYLSRRS